MADPVLFKDAYLALGTATGAYRNWSASLKSLSFPLVKAELANSVMGDEGETFEQGLESLQISATLRQEISGTGSVGISPPNALFASDAISAVTSLPTAEAL